MHRNKLISAFLLIASFLLISNFQISPATADYSDVTLGTAGSFAILAGTAITDGGVTITGTDSHAIGNALLGETPAVAALADLITAIEFIDNEVVAVATVNISGTTLIPGIYSSKDSALSIGGTVTLDGGGDESAVFVIHSGFERAIDFAAGTQILLVNNAQSSNVYWIAGSALGVGVESSVAGNLIARSAMTIGEGSTLHGAVLAGTALTIGATVVLEHTLLVTTVVTPPPAPPIYYVPQPVIELPTPVAETPVPEVIVEVLPIEVVPEEIVPVAVDPIPIATPSVAPSIEPIATPPVQPEAPVVVIDTPIVAVKSSSLISRSDYEKYIPADNPKKTTNTAIAAFATLTVISAGAGMLGSGNTKQMGFLAQVGRGGAIAAGVTTGRGDRRRERRTKNPGRFVNFFTVLATKVSTLSPLAARTISDGSYLRAIFGNASLFVYPLAAAVGLGAASQVNFQALPPSLLFMALLMGIGILDAMAGFLASIFFSILVIANGNVADLHSFLTLAGVVLVAFGPGLLAGAFRPFRREVTTSRDLWERGTDYILASILAGWVVKQIVAGLPGLSGLDLPIAEHANSLGVIAGVFVALRFFAEDLVNHFFPKKIADLEPEYRSRNARHALLTAALQILVFALVAQPFIGWKVELWIGMAIFALPIFLTMISTRFPKSEFLGRWLPSGVIEIIIVTLAGLYIASLLQNNIEDPTRYVLIAFVVLSIPAFVLKVLPLFGDQYLPTWRESAKGNATYRVLGLLVLAALIYIIFSGILG